MCFYRVDNSGKETEEEKANSDAAIDAMPESLRESLNVSASVGLKSAKLFVTPASRM